MRRVQKVGLLAHTGKPQAVEAARRAAEWLQARGAQAVVDPEGATVATGARGDESELFEGIDAAVVLGGDGAFLKGARLLAPRGVPLLGVNAGRLGFLSEVELTELDAALERLMAGEYAIEERLMLVGGISRQGEEAGAYTGLNDLVISRGTFARIIEVRVEVGGAEIGTYTGDGIIISTPTGSTAYSLSAGGPIVHPRVEGMIVTPICPHTLSARSTLVPADEEIAVYVDTRGGEDVMLTVDGQLGAKLTNGDVVRVRRAPWTARLIRLQRREFYDLLRLRLNVQAGGRG